MKQWCCSRAWPGIVAVIAAMVTAGCGGSDDLPRQPISGKVSFDGEPLTKAWIQFRPVDGGGNTTSAAMIEAGSYSIPRSQGLVPGTYRVAITKLEEPASGDTKTEPAPQRSATAKSQRQKKAGVGSFGFAKQLIPAQYNLKSKLEAKVQEGQTNAFDFTLTSK